MQGDKDGKNKPIAEKLIKEGIIQQKNIFEFKYDFETSVPTSLSEGEVRLFFMIFRKASALRKILTQIKI